MAYAEKRPFGWHKWYDDRPRVVLLTASKTAHGPTRQARLPDPAPRDNMAAMLEAVLHERRRRDLYLNCERSMGVPK